MFKHSNTYLVFEDSVSILSSNLMSENITQGCLIVFEGLDGAGKTTQIELLSQYLKEKDYPVVITSWNSSRLISKAIKRAKKAHLLLRIFTALYMPLTSYTVWKILFSLHSAKITS